MEPFQEGLAKKTNPAETTKKEQAGLSIEEEIRKLSGEIKEIPPTLVVSHMGRTYTRRLDLRKAFESFNAPEVTINAVKPKMVGSILRLRFKKTESGKILKLTELKEGEYREPLSVEIIDEVDGLRKELEEMQKSNQRLIAELSEGVQQIDSILQSGEIIDIPKN